MVKTASADTWKTNSIRGFCHVRLHNSCQCILCWKETCWLLPWCKWKPAFAPRLACSFQRINPLMKVIHTTDLVKRIQWKNIFFSQMCGPTAKRKCKALAACPLVASQNLSKNMIVRFIKGYLRSLDYSIYPSLDFLTNWEYCAGPWSNNRQAIQSDHGCSRWSHLFSVGPDGWSACQRTDACLFCTPCSW